MNPSAIKYKTKTASAEDIFSHLKACDDIFIPPLNQKVNLKEYSQKLFEKSITFEAWCDNILIGLIAAYFNDLKNYSGYITNVSIIREYIGKGIATELMKICIKYAKQSNFKEIKLEVSKENSKATILYEKFAFFNFENNHDSVVMKCILKS